jgi:hypothetical protein
MVQDPLAMITLIRTVKNEAEQCQVTAPDAMNLLQFFYNVHEQLYPPTHHISSERKVEISGEYRYWKSEQEPGTNFGKAEVAAALNINNKDPSERGYFDHVVRTDPEIEYHRARSANVTIRQIASGNTNGHDA